MAKSGFSQSYDVVVVGGGLGGLSCGAYLAKSGRSVKVLEKNPQPGGFCSYFTRGGFRFNSSLLFTNGYKPGGIMNQIIAELGMEGKIQVRQMVPFGKIVLPEGTFTVPAGLSEWEKLLVEDFPKEEGGIRKFLHTLDAVSDDMEKLPARSALLAKYQEKSIQQMVDEFITDRLLKSVITGIFYGNLPPSRFSALFWCHRTRRYLEEGGFVPLGGARTLAEAFTGALKKFGGELELGAGVRRVLVEEGRATGVETVDSRRIKAGVVVSNVAALQTFGTLVSRRELAPVAPDLVERLRCMKITPSALVVYVGTDLDVKSLGVDHVLTFLHDSSDYEKEYEEATRGNLAGSCFSISVLSLLDPSLAPPGQHTLEMYLYAPYSLPGSDWNRGIKERLAASIIKKAEKVLPGLSHHTVVQESASPRTLERYTLSTEGSPVGWAYVPANLFARPDPKTPIPGLYMVGHWTSHGGSMKGVASSGRQVAQMIIGGK